MYIGVFIDTKTELYTWVSTRSFRGDNRGVPKYSNLGKCKEVFLRAIVKAFIPTSSYTLRRSCIHASPSGLKGGKTGVPT
jgi:hypothetical protein